MTFLNFKSTEKTALFIDGANLYKAARVLGFDIDYKQLLSIAKDETMLVRAFYFTSIQEEKDQDYSPLRPLIDWLDYNGYTMITKISREFVDGQGKKRYRGSTDIELAVEILTLAEHLDHIILFSGNGDFRRVIEAAQAKGTRVTVVSSIKTNPPMIADEIRRQADNFIDLVNLEGTIGRASGGMRKQHHDISQDDDFEYEDDAFEDDYEDHD